MVGETYSRRMGRTPGAADVTLQEAILLAIFVVLVICFVGGLVIESKLESIINLLRDKQEPPP